VDAKNVGNLLTIRQFAKFNLTPNLHRIAQNLTDGHAAVTKQLTIQVQKIDGFKNL